MQNKSINSMLLNINVIEKLIAIIAIGFKVIGL